MKKSIKNIFYAGLFVLSSFGAANAALVDNGLYNTDTDSGLDWLDLSVTFGQSYNNALTDNVGWRYATNTEVENLFLTMFSNYSPNNIDNSWSYTTTVFVDAPFQFDQATDMALMFGRSFDRSTAVFSSYGFYLDENNLIRVMGAENSGSNCFYDQNDVIRCNFYTSILGPEYTDVYSELTESSTVGVFMVRNSVVPVPAAVWLFCSGLIGLAGFANRKKNNQK